MDLTKTRVESKKIFYGKEDVDTMSRSDELLYSNKAYESMMLFDNFKEHSQAYNLTNWSFSKNITKDTDEEVVKFIYTSTGYKVPFNGWIECEAYVYSSSCLFDIKPTLQDAVSLAPHKKVSDNEVKKNKLFSRNH